MNVYFQSFIHDPSFSPNEEKKFECFRLNSFKHWPQDSEVFPLKLAQVGFFYMGKGDETICYFCGAKKENWKCGDNAADVHRSLNPNCPLILGRDCGNIPFQCISHTSPFIQRLDRILEDLDNYEGYSRQVELNTPTADPMRNVGTNNNKPHKDLNHNNQSLQNQPNYQHLPQNGAKQVVSKEICPTKPKTQTIRPMESPHSPSHTSKSEPGKGYDIPPPIGEAIGPLRFERNRLETFKNWPSTACVSAAELAKQGFHYTGTADRVQCIFCKGYLRNWNTGDRPDIEHRRHFPRCPLVLGMKIGNVPLPLEHSPTASQGSMSGSPSIENVIDSLSTENRGNAAVLGIVTDRPKHPLYAIVSQRLSTFRGWPPYRDQTPQQLAEAGFWYAGFNDNVKCFFCDGGLRNWDPGDDPWEEHARWFPRCQFVLQVKGQDYINQVLQKYGGEVQIPNYTQGEIQNPPPSSSTGTGSSRTIDEQAILARMDQPCVRKLLDNNFDRDLIMRTIRQRLQQTGEDFPSSTSLVEAVYALEAEERASQPPPRPPPPCPSHRPPHDTPAAGTSAPPPSDSGTDIPGPGVQGEGDNGATAGANSLPGPSQGNSGNSTLSLQSPKSPDELLKENLELREQRLCKICMTHDANMVFLPCGHLVSCAACAPALTLCPICRATIKGSIRTYIV